MGVSILGDSRLALSSRLWSPGSSAKSAQPLVMSLSSIRTIMMVSPGPVLHALRTMPTCSLGSAAPSYICTGLALRAQPILRSATAVRHPPHRCHADVLGFLIGRPFLGEQRRPTGHLPRLALFKATAARTKVFSAFSSIFSPSWKSMARLVFPSRLELKRPEGSFRDAPLAKVIFTTCL